MVSDKHKAEQPNGAEKGKKTVEPQAQTVGDLCRCKETALMKPRQLLQLMINDLAFWKKDKKG